MQKRILGKNHLEVSSIGLGCWDLEVSLIPFSPLGRGFLTGTIKSPLDLKDNDYRSNMPRFDSEAMEENLKLITMLQELADKMEISLAQLSLAWLLAQDDSIVPIPGMKQQKYIDENIKAVCISLTKEYLEQINTMEVSIKGRRHNQYNLEFIDE